MCVPVSPRPAGVLQLGSKATLLCRVQGLKFSPRLEWEKPDGGPAGFGEVDLNPVARTHEGSWVCKFSHGGETFRETLEVKVQG